MQTSFPSIGQLQAQERTPLLHSDERKKPPQVLAPIVTKNGSIAKLLSGARQSLKKPPLPSSQSAVAVSKVASEKLEKPKDTEQQPGHSVAEVLRDARQIQEEDDASEAALAHEVALAKLEHAKQNLSQAKIDFVQHFSQSTPFKEFLSVHLGLIGAHLADAKGYESEVKNKCKLLTQEGKAAFNWIARDLQKKVLEIYATTDPSTIRATRALTLQCLLPHLSDLVKRIDRISPEAFEDVKTYLV
jgi:hypothetical protein